MHAQNLRQYWSSHGAWFVYILRILWVNKFCILSDSMGRLTLHYGSRKSVQNDPHTQVKIRSCLIAELFHSSNLSGDSVLLMQSCHLEGIELFPNFTSPMGGHCAMAQAHDL